MIENERLVLRKTVDSHEGQISPATIYRRCLFWAKNNVALWVGISSVLIGATSIWFTGLDYRDSIKIVNRPYLAVDTVGLDELGVGKVKSNLNDLSNQILEKNIKFVIKNTGQSPAAFRIDLLEFEEPGLKDVIPVQNEKGIIFPGESKEVRYLLEIHSSFPPTELERQEQKDYLEKSQEVMKGNRKYLSRIRVVYDYLDKKGKGVYSTFIDQTYPKTGFSMNEAGRFDGYSKIWIVSFDSE